jgi:hypothetical protein
MREITGDLWNHYAKPHTIILLTTNGSTTKDGRAVMGRGNALQAKRNIPSIDAELGAKLRTDGNHIHSLDHGRIYNFPVKHQWFESARVELIEKSAAQLDKLAQRTPGNLFVLPRPGCGCGGLRWIAVKPVLEFLPDNVYVIDLP